MIVSKTNGLESQRGRAVNLALALMFAVCFGCNENADLTTDLTTDLSADAKVRTVGVASPRLRNLDSPASRRQRLTETLGWLAMDADQTQFVQVIQDAVPSSDGPPAAKPIPIEIIPTPKGVLENSPKPDKQAVPKREDTPNLKDASDVAQADLIAAALKLKSYKSWKKPDVTIFVTGQQNGYLEPCGCTGLANQKGGVARRHTFLKQLRDKGWTVIPFDAGNQIRRVGQQATLKFSYSAEALKGMKYQAVGFGPEDMRLAGIDLIQTCAMQGSPEDALFVSGNVVLFDDASFMPTYKVISENGHAVGLTSILDPKQIDATLTSDVKITPPVESAKLALKEMTAKGASYKVLSYYGKEEAAEKLVQAVPGYDLIIVAGGYGEPHYKLQDIKGSKTKLVVPGNKGMYAGLIGLYKDSEPQYNRVPLTDEFGDAPEMRQVMKKYQEQLRDLGFERLGLNAIPHPKGDKFVGSKVCGECHKKAYEVWEFSPHVDATDSIVTPSDGRGDIARNFDPECVSCHVTGWNPQGYRPYASGYESLESSKHLFGNGCENCHGPGKAHTDAERPNAVIDEAQKQKLRKGMVLTFERAREHCMQCHDLDNSPDFHEPEAFEEDYWPQIEHEGKD